MDQKHKNPFIQDQVSDISIDIPKKTNETMIRQGVNVLNDSKDSLSRTLRIIHETKMIGHETAGTLERQTEQLEKMNNDLSAVQENTKSANRIISRIGRKLLTDRYIVCLSFLVLVAIILVIVFVKR